MHAADEKTGSWKDTLFREAVTSWINAVHPAVFCAFIPFFAFKELGGVLGGGTIKKPFFQKRDAAWPGQA